MAYTPPYFAPPTPVPCDWHLNFCSEISNEAWNDTTEERLHNKRSKTFVDF